jgi:hypothetical protein
MVKAIILLSTAAFSIWTRVFSGKWWWLERESLFRSKFSQPERRARWKLLLMLFLVAMPIYFGGESIAVHNGVDLRLWCWYAFVVGIIVTRPICTFCWPDDIAAGDEAAAKRESCSKERHAAPPLCVRAKPHP